MTMRLRRLALPAALLVAAPAAAELKTWDGGAGTLVWTTPANWSPDGVPTAADDVVIDVPGSTVTISVPAGTATCNTLASNETISVTGTLSIAGPSTVNGLITVTGTLTGAGNVTLAGGLTLSGASATGSGTLTIPVGATLTLNTSTNSISGKTIDVAGQAQWTAGQLNATNATLHILGGGVFQANSAATIANASGTNAIINDGTVLKSSNASTIGIPFTNNGAVEVDGGALTLGGSGANNGTIDVAAGATLTLSTGRTWGATSFLGGAGAIQFDQGSQVLPAGTFSPSGSFRVTGGGSVTLNNTFPPETLLSPLSGTLTMNVDQTFPALTLTGTLTGPGNATFPSGLTLDSANLSGGGITTIPVGATLSLTTNTSTVSSRTVEVAGTVDWPSSQVNFSSATLHVQSGGVFQMNAAATLTATSGTNALINDGTVVKSSNASTIGIPFTNNGAVEVDAGTLTLSAAGANDGTIDVAAGATLTITANRTWGPSSLLTGAGAIQFDQGTHVLPAGTFSPSGSFRVTGSGSVTLNNTFPPATLLSPLSGTLTMNVDQTFPALTLTGTLGGPGNSNFPSGLTLNSANLSGGGITTIPVGATLTFTTNTSTISSRTIEVAGTVDWPSSQVNFSSSTLHILAGGVFQMNAAATLTNTSGTNALVNDGTMLKSSSASTIGIPFTNNGAVEVDAGTLTLSATGASNGTIDVAPGATLTLTANRTWGPASLLTGGGAIQFDQGTHVLPAGTFSPSGSFRVTGSGSVTLNNTFPPPTLLSPLSGTLTMNVDQTFPALSVTGTLGGPGNNTFPSGLTLNSANLSGAGTTTIPVGATLTFTTNTNTLNARTIEVAGTVDWATNQLNFQNATIHTLPGGIFRAQASAAMAQAAGVNAFVNDGTFEKTVGASTVNIPFTTSGLVDVSGGSVSFSSSFTQTAGSTLIGGGSFTKSGGVVALQGGVLGGTGTLTGAVTQTGGSIAPGLSPGTFTITGTVTQNASSTLDVELGGLVAGSQYDRLVGNGSVAAAGTLRVSFVNGFLPHGGDTFTVATAATLTGGYPAVDVVGYPDCVASAAKVGNTIVVTIESVPPTALCRNIDVNLSAAGTASITPAMIDNGSTDNCEVASLELDTTDFTCSDLGPNVVTLTVKDHAQNSATCQAVVTVHDVTAPVIVGFPADAAFPCAGQIPAPNTSLVTATDACGPITVTHVGDVGNGGAGCPASPLVVTRTYRATDGSGNASEKHQHFTVADAEAPSFVGFPADQTLSCPGSIPPPNPGALNATDGCGGGVSIVHVGDQSNGGAGCPASPLVVVRTYKAIDGCGNQVSRSQTFTVVDTQAPSFDLFPEDQLLACAADVPAPDVSAIVSVDACDPAPLVTHAGDVDNGGAGCPDSPLVITRTYRTTDACGNTAERSQTFTVVDDGAPTILVPPPDGGTQADCGGAAMPDLRGTIEVEDGCGVLSIEQTPAPGTPLTVGVTVVQFVINDACGNSVETSASFEVAADPCTADFDNSGAVDAIDLASLLGSWGDCTGCCADLDRDGTVSAPDIAILLGAWGACPTADSSSSEAGSAAAKPGSDGHGAAAGQPASGTQAGQPGGAGRASDRAATGAAGGASVPAAPAVGR